MRFWALEGNRFKLDGGALFGNAPKGMWSKLQKPDDMNRLTLASRSLLWETDEGDLILFEAGLGDFFEEPLRERFCVEPRGNQLLESLRKIGKSPDQVTKIVLSHLHFDHSGGLLNGEHLAFSQAKIYLHEQHWERAQNPLPREKASFIPQLHDLLKQSGRLQLIREDTQIHPLLSFKVSHGHTVGMLLSYFRLKRPVLFCADLTPGISWTSQALSMGYDRFAELVCVEKEKILSEVLHDHGYVFYTHDPEHIVAEIFKNEKGQMSARSVSFEEVFTSQIRS